MLRLLTLLSAVLLAPAAALSQAVTLPPFSAMAPGAPAAPWRIAALPGQKLPVTQFSIQPRDGSHVLQVVANASYGNLVLDTPGVSLGPGSQLRWRWSLEQALGAADLRTKAGDDVALKVCALFDMPLDGLPLGERTKMRMARSLSGQPLPAATLCYVWDRSLPVGTELANAFSPRVRYVVAATGPAQAGRWASVERALSADFLRAFGHETTAVPPLMAIAVGADADNTGGQSLGYVGDVVLLR